MKLVMTIAKNVALMTTRTHEAVTRVAIAWIKTGMKRANHGREWFVEEMQFITLTASVNRSLLYFFEIMVTNNVIERDLMFVTGDTRCTIRDVAFEAHGQHAAILVGLSLGFRAWNLCGIVHEAALIPVLAVLWKEPALGHVVIVAFFTSGAAAF